jgi:hypothetical protein
VTNGAGRRPGDRRVRGQHDTRTEDGHEISVQVASSCESRYHTIHVDQIDPEGGLKIHADADSRTEYRPFAACYTDGLKARAEERRKAGQPVYEGLTRASDVELD